MSHHWHANVGIAWCPCDEDQDAPGAIAPVPDPRFRDQLVEVLRFCSGDLEEWADALMPTIAAEVEARVQAAGDQRAAEELDGVADELLGFGDTAPSKAQVHLAGWLQATADNLRAAALASPPPAPQTGGEQ